MQWVIGVKFNIMILIKFRKSISSLSTYKFVTTHCSFSWLFSHDQNHMYVSSLIYLHTLEDAHVFYVETTSPCYIVPKQTNKHILNDIDRNFPSFRTFHKSLICSWHQFLWVCFERFRSKAKKQRVMNYCLYGLM